MGRDTIAEALKSEYRFTKMTGFFEAQHEFKNTHRAFNACTTLASSFLLRIVHEPSMYDD